MSAGLHVCMSTLRQHNITGYGCLWWVPAYTCACNPATIQHNRLRLSLMSVGLHVCMSTLRQHNITGYGCLWWVPAYMCACQPCDNTTWFLYNYIAQYPVRWTAQSASQFSSPGRPVHEFRHQLSFSGKHSSHAAIAQRLFDIARYSFINTAEWTDVSWREQKCPNFETVVKGNRIRALSIASLAFYHWATALQRHVLDECRLTSVVNDCSMLLPYV